MQTPCSLISAESTSPGSGIIRPRVPAHRFIEIGHVMYPPTLQQKTAVALRLRDLGYSCLEGK